MSLISCKNCGKQISDMAETCPHCGEKTKGEMKMYSREIYNLFIETLSNNLDFKFNENPDQGSLLVPQVGIDSSLKSISVLITVREEDCVLYGFYDNFKISSENIAKICELLARINFDYIYPQMIFDFQNQVVICRYQHLFSEDLLNTDVAAQAFMDVGLHLQRCGNAIMAVALGIQEPEDAINVIKHD